MKVLLIYLLPLDNEPIGLMYIGTVLKNAGHCVKIIGIEKHNPDRTVLGHVVSFLPDVVGLNIFTSLAGEAQRIARLIKDNFPGMYLIAGGPHATILPYETLREKCIDICVIGEGESTVVNLLDSLGKNLPLEKIDGIAFLRNANIVFTNPREYIQDLDTLPFVDRELMPKDVIYGRAGYPLENPCAFIMTVRGCPYACSFCKPGLDKIFGSRVRRRSPENVIKEIIELKGKYGIRGLWINDDTFTFDAKWVNKFCDLITEGKLDISWYINARLNNVDEQLFIKMRKAGCVSVVLTPEVGSERIRNIVLNKQITDKEIEEAFKVCHKIGLAVQANIMLGSPTETEADLKLSLDLIRKIQPHYMNISYTTALPGTYLYDQYFPEMSDSPYYKEYANYDFGSFKKIGNQIPDKQLKKAWQFFISKYGKSSFVNRARHFICYPEFRRVLFKRWRTLLFSRHPKLNHLIYDMIAILIGSIEYIWAKKVYKTECYSEQKNFS